jgi:hypothetical protein
MEGCCLCSVGARGHGFRLTVEGGGGRGGDVVRGSLQCSHLFWTTQTTFERQIPFGWVTQSAACLELHDVGGGGVARTTGTAAAMHVLGAARSMRMSVGVEVDGFHAQRSTCHPPAPTSLWFDLFLALIAFCCAPPARSICECLA